MKPFRWIKSRWFHLCNWWTCRRKGHDWVPLWIRAQDGRKKDGDFCKRCSITRLSLNAMFVVYYLPGVTDLLNRPRILSKYMALGRETTKTEGKPVVIDLNTNRKDPA